MRCAVAITPDVSTAAQVDLWRAQYDAFFKLVGPHLTVAFPDECAGDLDTVSSLLQQTAAQTNPFTLALNRWATVRELLQEHRESTQFLLERYPNAANLIVLLATDGAAEFLQLRRDLSQAIPQPALLENYPPYLTLGQSLTDATLERARAELENYQPNIQLAVREIHFYVEQPDGSWPVISTYRLGGE